ncbi:hypothetical protein M8J75_006393 [Diaphorina citri]|nr:hypothetical protein M8J75_006393 [Diaphorina citri]
MSNNYAPQIIAANLACLTTLLGGCWISWASVSLNKLSDTEPDLEQIGFRLSKYEISWMTSISKENEKLKETVQSLEQKCADQRKINNSLLDEGGVNEEEISRKQNEDAKLISSLRKKIETKDMEISQLQETMADMKSSIKKLTDENLNTKVLLDARLNEEENRKKKETQQTSQPGTSAQSSRPGTNAQSSRPGTSTQSLSTADNVEEPSSPPTPSDVATGAEDNYTDHVTKPDININKLFVIGDSHTRELQSILQQSKSSKFVAKVICMPGSTFGQVVNAIKPDKVSANTMICVVAGTNDVFKTSWNSIQSSIDKLYSKCKNNQILIVLSPPRFDVKRINKHIINLNVKVKHYISKYKNMTCLDPHNFINIHHMSTDLLHLNGRGKFLLCSKIVHKVFGSSLSVDTATVHNSNKSIHSNQHYRNNQHNQHKLQFNSVLDGTVEFFQPLGENKEGLFIFNKRLDAVENIGFSNRKHFDLELRRLTLE